MGAAERRLSAPPQRGSRDFSPEAQREPKGIPPVTKGDELRNRAPRDVCDKPMAAYILKRRSRQRTRLFETDVNVMMHSLGEQKVVERLPFPAQSHSADRVAVPKQWFGDVGKIVVARQPQPQLVVLRIPKVTSIAAGFQNQRATERNGRMVQAILPM